MSLESYLLYVILILLILHAVLQFPSKYIVYLFGSVTAYRYIGLFGITNQKDFHHKLPNDCPKYCAKEKDEDITAPTITPLNNTILLKNFPSFIV